MKRIAECLHESTASYCSYHLSNGRLKGIVSDIRILLSFVLSLGVEQGRVHT